MIAPPDFFLRLGFFKVPGAEHHQRGRGRTAMGENGDASAGVAVAGRLMVTSIAL